jgi:hypothetical protein
MFRSSRDFTNKYHLVLLESLAILSWCKRLWLLKISLSIKNCRNFGDGKCSDDPRECSRRLLTDGIVQLDHAVWELRAGDEF